ncbi:MAG: NTF2 fold immunity protein [Luteolibacter sp.]
MLLPIGRELWAGRGNEHAGLDIRGLYRRDTKGRWHTIVDGMGNKEDGPLSLPAAAAIRHISSDSQGRLLITSGQAVCRWDGKVFETLLSVPKRILRSAAATPRGDLLVLTDDNGGPAFGEREGVWRCKQLLPGPSTAVPVKDEARAIAIAVEAWEAAYGKDVIAKEKPYQATAIEGGWQVTSTPRSDGDHPAKAMIAEADGRVWSLSHGQ